MKITDAKRTKLNGITIAINWGENGQNHIRMTKHGDEPTNIRIHVAGGTVTAEELLDLNQASGAASAIASEWNILGVERSLEMRSL
jgi:hypothetical protein